MGQTLEPQQQLGHYRVMAALGAGGLVRLSCQW